MSFSFAFLWGLFLVILYSMLATSILEPVSDRWWEDLEAIVLLLTLIIYLVRCPTSKISLSLGIVLLIGLGEEIKWGLGFAFKNFFNLHEMGNQVVHLLLGFTILFAIAAHFKKIDKICRSIFLPTPSLFFVPALLLTLLFETPGASESREMVLYLAFFGSVIFSTLRWREKNLLR